MRTEEHNRPLSTGQLITGNRIVHIALLPMRGTSTGKRQFTLPLHLYLISSLIANSYWYLINITDLQIKGGGSVPSPRLENSWWESSHTKCSKKLDRKLDSISFSDEDTILKNTESH